MTANKTPRQQLMSPVDSDLFLSTDFADTMAKLDAVPGTTIVANYAALTALTWGTAQHGSKVLQADNGAEWYWYHPSGTGVWKRSNSVGILKRVVQSAPITTSLLANGPTFVTSGNFTVPGGRPIRINLNMGIDNTSGQNGIVIISLLDGATLLAEFNYRAGTTINSNGTNYQADFDANVVGGVAWANNSTHVINAKIRSASLTAAVGGGGTSASRKSVLTISEG